MQESREKTLNEALTPLWLAIKRYWKVAVWPALATFGVVSVLAYRIPSFYAADTLIFMQPQRINSKILEEQKREEVNERLQALVLEILSRPRLKAIVDRFKPYPEYTGVEGAEHALRKLRKAIVVAPAQSATGGQQPLQTFKLSFTHRDPNMVFEITKAISNLFIEESVYDRRSEVQGTQDFFDAQLTESRKKLEETENQVQEFVRQNFGKLPEHLDQAVARLQNLQSQLESNTQLLSANMTRRGNLERELEEVRKLANSIGADDPRMAASDPAEAVEQLQAALAVLRSRYTEQHPDVVATKKRIDALKEQIAKGGGRKNPAPRVSGAGASAVLTVKRQLNEVDIQIANYQQENERLKKQIEVLNADIQSMPVKEQELLKIKRDYANLKDTYQKLMGERDSAGLQASMIRSQKATQLRVVEPPEKPTEPAGPPRALIGIGGFVFALLLLVTIPIGLYFLNGSFRSKEEVEETLGVKVLGVIPPMITPEALGATRRIQWLSGAASAVSFLALSAVIVMFIR